jgi:hypothetical protein
MGWQRVPPLHGPPSAWLQKGWQVPLAAHTLARLQRVVMPPPPSPPSAAAPASLQRPPSLVRLKDGSQHAPGVPPWLVVSRQRLKLTACRVPSGFDWSTPKGRQSPPRSALVEAPFK